MRTLLIWISAVLVFGYFYHLVAAKESLRRNGQSLYLELSPVDPRSPFQGDYMALRYAITDKLMQDQDTSKIQEPDNGTLVVQVDSQGVAHFVRYHHGGPLVPGEHLLKYRHNNGTMIIGAETYFIPEGSGPSFAHATYGELKVDPTGTPLLVALCDKILHPIVPINPNDQHP